MPDRRVIVVGTTGDYIELIRKRYPARSLFITDPQERARWSGDFPDPSSEILCDLVDSKQVWAALRKHMSTYDIQPTGVACYDCETLALAADLAKRLSLPFPSRHSVINCRSKFTSKRLWREAGIPCPEAALVKSLADAVQFIERLNSPVVLKPLTGSGSELVMLCETRAECVRAYQTLKTRLADHPNRRMYAAVDDSSEGEDPRKVFAVEEKVSGREFSCDFLLDDDRLEIIRLTRKLHAPDQPLGTILAYVLPGVLPGELDIARFQRQLKDAANVLGLKRTIAMVDFIVRKNEAVLLELTPRPGGDCLPELIRQSCGLDIIGANLDFAEGKTIPIPAPEKWQPLVGLRLFASRSGTILAIDADDVRHDGRVLSCDLKHGPGHRIVMPPDDYESRLLGSVIFKPTHPQNIETESLEIAGKLRLELETPSWAITRLS